MKRKTVSVDWIRAKVNYLIALRKKEYYGVKDADSFRQGVESVLEIILHETGNYKGYMYLDGIDNPTLRMYLPVDTEEWRKLKGEL
jgi:hypothetical protein